MRLFSPTLLLIPIQLLAAPLIVDGPGDGDGDGIDDLDSVREALIALGPEGSDGVSDEIHIMVDAITETTGWVINGTDVSGEITHGPSSGEYYWPLHDSITILGDADGNGVRCVMDVSSRNKIYSPSRDLLSIRLADDQTVMLKDLVLIPTAHITGQVLANFIDVDEGDSSTPLENATFVLDNLMVTASLPSGEPMVSIPQDPDDLSVWGTAIVALFDGFDVLGVRSNPPSSELHCVVRNSVFAHQRAGVLAFGLTSGTVDIIDTRVTHNGFAYYYSGGVIIYAGAIGLLPEGDVTANLTRVTCERDVGGGLGISRPDLGRVLTVNVGPGCRFNNNGTGVVGGGVGSGMADIRILGTPGDPVEIMGNGRGISLNATHSTIFCQDAIISGNDEVGVSLSWVGYATVPPSFDRCLIANNGADFEEGVVPVNVVIRSPSSLPATAEFNACTFHDLQSTQTYPGGDLSIPTQISLPHLIGERKATVNLTNCIISGSDDEDAFNLGSADKVVNLTNCAIVMEGEHGLGSINSTGQGTVNMTDCIFIDPQYLNVNVPPDADSFDVNATFYGHAGPDGGPLSGWGDYVGDPYDGGGAGIEVH